MRCRPTARSSPPPKRSTSRPRRCRSSSRNWNRKPARRCSSVTAAACGSPTRRRRWCRARKRCCRCSKRPRPNSRPPTPRSPGRSPSAPLPPPRAGSRRRRSSRCARSIRDLAITFHEQEPGESIPRLVRRDVDLIIVNDWQNAPIALPEGLTKAPLFDDIADIALPPGHRLAKAKTRQAERPGRRGVDRVAGRIDLPRLADAHAAQGGPRAEDRAHRR